MSGVKLELASDAWIKAAAPLLREALHEAGEGVAGISFALCEIYTEAPVHLLAPGEDELAWTLSISKQGECDVRRGADANAPCRLRMPYERASLGARTILSAAPEEILKRSAARAAAAAAGLIQAWGVFDATPMPMRVLITHFHNKLAAITA